jgi:hypothetical protein
MFLFSRSMAISSIEEESTAAAHLQPVQAQAHQAPRDPKAYKSLDLWAWSSASQ